MVTEVKPTSLWRHPGFLKLWSGQIISLFGTEVTTLALALTAINLLGANPLQMGILAAVSFVPHVLFGLVAGVWVDRMRRKPIMIIADLGRAILLASIPLAAFNQLLRMEQLYIIAFLLGIFTLFFEVAYNAYLPSLVSRQQLVDGNARMEFSQSIVKVAGPGLGGTIIQVLTAPIAIVVDALSFLVSALALMLIREREPEPLPVAQRRAISAEIREGLSFALRQQFLRLIIISTATNAFFLTAQGAIFVLYMTRDLGITPFMLGIIFSLGGLGSVLGALVAQPLSRRLGIGPAIIVSHILFALAILLLPAASLLREATALVLVLSNVCFGFGLTTKAITAISFRQSITPDHLLGRVAASGRFLSYPMLPLGSLLGGVVGSILGLAPTLLLCGIGSLGVALWLMFSPLRHVQASTGLPELDLQSS